MRLFFASVVVGTVTAAACAGGGDVRWRFDLTTPFSADDLSVGSDGTIYAADNQRLHAIAPDGTLRWSRAGVGGQNGVGALPDGRLISGLGDTVLALDPADGSALWAFTYDSNGLREEIEVGPTVGPDGNVYGVTSVEDGFGLGAFSLNPAGQLRWADQGTPLLNRITIGTGERVLFSQDRMVFPFEFVAAGTNAVYAYGLDGEQTQYVDFTCTSPPRVDPAGRIILSGSCGYEAVSTDADEVFWSTALGGTHAIPAVGADGTVYGARWFGPLTAIRPDGSVRWVSSDADGVTAVIGVDAAAGQVVCVSGEFGTPDTVLGVDAATGVLLWSTDLRTVGGHDELVFCDETAFAPDGSAVYLVTRFTSNGHTAAVYAISTAACQPDLDASGTLTIADIQAFVDLYNAADPAADLAQPGGVLNVFDLTAYISLYSAGCP